MQGMVEMVRILRGDAVESTHFGHAVICNAKGEIVAAWGRPEQIIYPRSACKMIQAIPLVESAAGQKLGSQQIALACASHQGSHRHAELVDRWMAEMGLADDDFRCGAHLPYDMGTAEGLIRDGAAPRQVHNNCSGKHAGFLCLASELGGGPEYVEPDHPVQQAVRATFEEMTGSVSPYFGVDGCSAPNFATPLAHLARAAARMTGFGDNTVRGRACRRIVSAMIAHPELVAGEGRACTELMRAAGGAAAIKTGAEGVFVSILPETGLGIALKIADGATRASEAAIAALLVHAGALAPEDPVAKRYSEGPIRNRRDIVTGRIALADGFPTQRL